MDFTQEFGVKVLKILFPVYTEFLTSNFLTAYFISQTFFLFLFSLLHMDKPRVISLFQININHFSFSLPIQTSSVLPWFELSPEASL